jgi:uncharacterized YccA/Bax inhibitor family protein
MHLLLTNQQLWVTLIGSIVPLGGYVINKFAPWISESVKGVVQVVLAAVAGGLYTAIDTSVFGLNQTTVSLVFSAVVAALAAHNFLWKPAKINTLLGAREHQVPAAPSPVPVTPATSDVPASSATLR